MSATLIPGYTGLLENVQVTQVARILHVPITDGAVQYGQRSIPGPTEKFSFTVQRDALFDAIRVHEADVQTEGEVFSLLARWNDAKNAESDPDEGLRRSARPRKASVRDEIQMIYPIFSEQDLGGGQMIGGR